MEEEQAAQEAYELELADYHIYEVMRKFASAARAMALYDCRLCIAELESLPDQHKRSASVMAMLGKAHYELGQYPEVRNLQLTCRTCVLASGPNSCLSD